MDANDIKHHRLMIYTRQLYEEFDGICYAYRIKLSKPLIVLERMGKTLGLWDALSCEIKINFDFILSQPWEQVIGILKHEMAHQIVSQIFQVEEEPHGARFKTACDLIAVPVWARSATIHEPFENWDLLKVFSPSPTEQAILRKVEKLLALAQSANEHEAVAAVKKVKELSDAYQIHEASFLKKDDYDTLTICHEKKAIPYYQKKICSILIEFFFVRVVFSQIFDARTLQTYKIMVLLGTKSHLQIAEYVYWFLFRQLPSLFETYKQTKGQLARRSRDSFYLGVLEGFSKQLKDIHQEGSTFKRASFDHRNKEQDHASLSLSCEKTKELTRLADRKLDDFMDYHFPRLHNVTRGRRVLDSSSYKAGHKEGEKLRLRKGLHSSDQKGGFGGYLGS